MVAPRAPLGKAASSSCVNLAIAASTFSTETWLLLRFFRCFAASSAAKGSRTSIMANTAPICFTSLAFTFWGEKCSGGRETFYGLSVGGS